jgi:hypothetical protein
MNFIQVFGLIMIIIKFNSDIHILENKNIFLHKLVNILSYENHEQLLFCENQTLIYYKLNN